MKDIEITPRMIRRGAGLMRALDHKFRQEILKLLEEAGEMSVTDIVIRLRIEQSVVSQHLTILRKAKLIRFDKQGKYHYYKIHYTNLKKLETFLQEI